MAYNSANRSERLLQNRRFTTDGLTLSQEAFTSVLDINASEIYTQQNYIPTASAGLPFSGSSQNNLIVSASVVQPGINPDLPILKYWYRKKMKPSADGTQQAYYFTSADPSTPTDAVASDQLIESGQQTNFISPKYIISANSSFNAEANPPGYKVIVYKSTSATAAGITEAASLDSTYVFDYKTGVLSWVTGNAPASNQYVYITAYQYVGETLNGRLTSLSASIAAVSSSGGGGGNGGYRIATGSVSASVSVGTNAFTVNNGANTLFNITSTGAVSVSGSLNVLGGITGSLLGTASYANNADLLDGKDSTIFATTGSNTFNGSQTIAGNIFLSSSFPLVYNNDPTNNMLFGLFDGSTIHGAYYQTFGNQYAALNQRGGAEFVYDVRNNAAANFHISSYNGATWTQKLMVNDAGVQVTGSLQVTAGITGSLYGTASWAENALTASYVPASAVVGLNLNSITSGSVTASVSIGANSFTIVSGSTTLFNITNAGLATVSNLTVSDNLIVNGTASFINTQNLTVKDKFVLINSGSTTLADSGWVTQYNAAGSGSAFYLDADSTGTYGRFAVAYDVLGSENVVSADEYVVTAKQAAGAPPATPTWGGATNGFGNIYVNSSNGDIYIYS